MQTIYVAGFVKNVPYIYRRNKRSMITPEAWTPVIINSQCSSIKWIERSTEYVLPRIQVCTIYIYIYIHQLVKISQLAVLSLVAWQIGGCNFAGIIFPRSHKIGTQFIFSPCKDKRTVSRYNPRTVSTRMVTETGERSSFFFYNTCV